MIGAAVREFQRKEAQRGMATLETIAFVIILVPVVVVGLAIMDYTYNSTLTHQLVDNYLEEVDFKSLKLDTFEQDYWLMERGGVIAPRLQAITDRLASDLEERLGTDRFRAEVGYASYIVNERSGEIDKANAPQRLSPAQPIANSDGPQQRGQHLALACAGKDSAGNVYQCLNSQNLPLSTSLLMKELDTLVPSPNSDTYIAGTPLDFSLVAIPSGLYGTRIQHHYGPSHIYGPAQRRYLSAPPGSPRNDRYISPYATSDFIRKGVVVGVFVEVDLENTYTGLLYEWLSGMRGLVAPANNSAGTPPRILPPKINVRKLMSPRVDF